MQGFSFQALGTQWSVLIDAEALPQHIEENIKNLVSHFEARFSRFQDDSEVNQFRHSQKGTYTVSEEFSEILTIAQELKKITHGKFDPAIGTLIEYAGYDKSYSFVAKPNIESVTINDWSIEGRDLWLSGPVVFDLGSIGKGYCIDLVSHYLSKEGYKHFLVEAGGDMHGTEKSDGAPFRIALEWPGKPDTAFGIICLKNQGLAASDTFRRRWPTLGRADRDENDWHHIIDSKAKKPVQEIIGVTAVAQSAFFADCMTSGIFLSSDSDYLKVQERFKGEYIYFTQDDKVVKSINWPGEFFE